MEKNNTGHCRFSDTKKNTVEDHFGFVTERKNRYRTKLILH